MQADFLLALTQAALDKYGTSTSEDALIMIDKSLLEPDDRSEEPPLITAN